MKLSCPDALSFTRCLLLVVQPEEPSPRHLITHRTEGRAFLLPPSKPSPVAWEELCFLVIAILRHGYTINYCNIKLEQRADLQRFSCFALTACVNALCLHCLHRMISHPSWDESAQASSYPAVAGTL